MEKFSGGSSSAQHYPDAETIETRELGELIEAARRLLKINAVNAIKVPDGVGYFLVKAETPEAAYRELEKKVVYQKVIDGVKYFICRS